MSELITKEELLELGFYCNNDETIFINKGQKISVGGKDTMVTLHISQWYTTKVVHYEATKNNVLKLIEIAKLIGELE